MFEKVPEFNKKTEKPEAEFPVGRARNLQELVSEEWKEHLLLFSQVKNKVLEVNHDVHTPLKLEEGKSSPLGLFAEAAFQEKPTDIPKGKQALEFWPMHRRSALLGRVTFGDKQGRIYRDIDLKGIGFVKEGQVKEPGGLTGSGRVGLLQEDMAFYDRQATEEFLLAGIRTSRTLAIIELKEIIVNGKKISINAAIERGICDKDFHPVVEVRAFGTKARVDDVDPNYYSEGGKSSGSKLLLEDAKKLVSQELGLKKIISDQDYLEWFAKTLGKNMGLMHKNGWLHNYISGHNITLDCRIVDFDAVTKFKSKVGLKLISEMEDAKDAVKRLVNLMFKKDKMECILDLFFKSYYKVCPR